jgi:D-alanyl-lipoteichoic acid acyltransferase DltB (MBOAT superfamily)
MLFNSIDFAVFILIVFLVYWFICKNFKTQNLVIVLASYLFYAWWDWRFLSLMLFSTLIDYLIGQKLGIEKSSVKRKILLCISIFTNLGLLFFFKYFNFFIDNFITAFTFFGYDIKTSSIHIILPLGISFFTFQTLSYTIDIYKQKFKPCKNLIAFAGFVSFFPQLVAGPIEKANNLLPQFYAKRIFNYNKAVDGMRQILWGLFKKIIIADNCAKYANIIFNNSDDYSGSTLVLGAILFTFQIYGDFSGYSDIAIGTSRLFGFNLMKNFSFPYFSRDIAEFWRRWHISLSTWFKDYLYIPLGGSRKNLRINVRNICIVFIVSGLWHGANWTFLVWGLLNAIYFTPLLLTKKNRINLDIVAKGRIFPNFKDQLSMLLTFILVAFSWIFFRSENIEHAISYITGIFSISLFTVPEILPITTILLILFFIIIEWSGREGEYGIENIKEIHCKPIRWFSYLSLLLIIYFFGSFEESVEFIYFQF